MVNTPKGRGKAQRDLGGAAWDASGGHRMAKSSNGRGGARKKGSGRKREKWTHEHVRG